MQQKHETIVEGQKSSLTEHHGKYLTCKSFVTLGLLAKDKPNHPVVDSLRIVSQENWSRTTLSGKANEWRNREHVILDLFSN